MDYRQQSYALKTRAATVAAQTLQAMTRGWHARQKVKKEQERHVSEARFNTVMDRHRERIYMLEAEKRELLKLNAGEVDEWQAKRHRAATKVQAHWRGLVERRRLTQRRAAKSALRTQDSRVAQEALNHMANLRRSTNFPGLIQDVNLNPAARASIRASASHQADRLGTPPPLGTQSRLLSLRPDQSGVVLMGSPEPSPDQVQIGRPTEDVEVSVPKPSLNLNPSPGPGGMGPLTYMSSKRYKDLLRQVEAKLSSYKAKVKHQRVNPEEIESRLKSLLRGYQTRAEPAVGAARQRQQALAASEALAAQLDQGLPTPLSEMPADAQPEDFPRPAKGTLRAERASQAHALMLAEVRAGTKWWSHLKSLNREDIQLSILQEEEERWEAMDHQWRRLWRSIEEEEQTKVDAEQGVHRVKRNEDDDLYRVVDQYKQEAPYSSISMNPLAQRPGSQPIVDPRKSMMASIGRMSLDYLHNQNPFKGDNQPRMPTTPRTDAVVGSVVLDQMRGDRTRQAVGAAVLNQLGGQPASPEVNRAVGATVLGEIEKQGWARKDERTKEVVGAAVLRQLGGTPASPAVNRAVGDNVLKTLQQR